MSKISNVIILTDIYGVTEAVNALKESLSTDAVNVTVIDPYGGIVKNFANESLAYQAFLDECGHDQYIARAIAEIGAIKQARGKVILLGFSAGASAAWKAIDRLEAKIDHLIGFYPSQIRSYLEVQPLCPVTLIYPCHETHFNVELCIAATADLKQVHSLQCQYLHGFMNPLSKNFNAQGSEHFNRYIADVSQLENVAVLRKNLRLK